MPSLQRSFSGDPASVAEARRFARRALIDWQAESLEAAATIVVSELATNTVLHAHSGFTMELTLDGGSLRVCISDTSVVAPRRRPHSAQATTGRGMMMVDALCDAWGVDEHPGGKTVWAELRADDPQRQDDSPENDSALLATFPALDDLDGGGVGGGTPSAFALVA